MSRVKEVGYDYIQIESEGERCELCKYCKRLEHNFRQGEGFELSYSCDVLYHLDDNESGWLQEVTPDSMCEMFARREK